MMHATEMTAPASLNPFSDPHAPSPPHDLDLLSPSSPSHQSHSTRSASAAGSSSASGHYSSIPLAVDSLEFQDLPHHGSTSTTSSTSSSSGAGGGGGMGVPGGMSAGSFSDSADLLAGSSSGPSDGEVAEVPIDPNASYFSLAYYRRYFDVSTELILSRLRRAIFPFTFPLHASSLSSFYSETLDGTNKPDMYGPFWIVTTLIILLAATGNFASYIGWLSQSQECADLKDSTTEEAIQRQKELGCATMEGWEYDFQKLTIGASIFYSFISILPLIVYFLLSRANSSLGLIYIASILGYSLLPLLPSSFLCVTPLNWVRWLSVSLALGVSCWFVYQNLWTEKENKKILPVVLAVMALHAGLALMTKWYFFNY